ncbi:hypothetical protein CEXT_389701 [Caerostris extrusa]|uniref:Uncharacterized protein n=1 Tax=Caerostris extrusa TaxID=172846 RepID=A0AAV4TYL6_CAEEX|nr:hypothetical protein CEXT_389701 [Caerostris extrusa]
MMLLPGNGVSGSSCYAILFPRPSTVRKMRTFHGGYLNVKFFGKYEKSGFGQLGVVFWYIGSGVLVYSILVWCFWCIVHWISTNYRWPPPEHFCKWSHSHAFQQQTPRNLKAVITNGILRKLISSTTQTAAVTLLIQLGKLSQQQFSLKSSLTASNTAVNNSLMTILIPNPNDSKRGAPGMLDGALGGLINCCCLENWPVDLQWSFSRAGALSGRWNEAAGPEKGNGQHVRKGQAVCKHGKPNHADQH